MSASNFSGRGFDSPHLHQLLSVIIWSDTDTGGIFRRYQCVLPAAHLPCYNTPNETRPALASAGAGLRILIWALSHLAHSSIDDGQIKMRSDMPDLPLLLPVQKVLLAEMIEAAERVAPEQ